MISEKPSGKIKSYVKKFFKSIALLIVVAFVINIVFFIFFRLSIFEYIGSHTGLLSPKDIIPGYGKYFIIRLIVEFIAPSILVFLVYIIKKEIPYILSLFLLFFIFGYTVALPSLILWGLLLVFLLLFSIGPGNYETKYCSNCGHTLSNKITARMSCPHCGAFLKDTYRR